MRTLHKDQTGSLTSFFDTVVADDFFLPSQYAASRTRSEWAPEKKLAFAVLYEALREIRAWTPEKAAKIGQLRGYRRESHSRAWHLHEEALEWLNSHDDRYVYSFESICSTLHISADVLRRHIAKGTFKLTRTPRVAASLRMVRPKVA